jgi:hypothetical protein
MKGIQTMIDDTETILRLRAENDRLRQSVDELVKCSRNMAADYKHVIAEYNKLKAEKIARADVAKSKASTAATVKKAETVLTKLDASVTALEKREKRGPTGLSFDEIKARVAAELEAKGVERKLEEVERKLAEREPPKNPASPWAQIH